MCKHGSCCLPIQKTFMIVNYALACVSLLPFLSSYSNKPYHISRIITNGKEQLTIHFNSETLEKFSKMNSKQERLGGVPTEQAAKGTPQKRPDGPDGPVQNEQHAQEQQEQGRAPEGARGGKGPLCVFCLEMCRLNWVLSAAITSAFAFVALETWNTMDTPVCAPCAVSFPGRNSCGRLSPV